MSDTAAGIKALLQRLASMDAKQDTNARPWHKHTLPRPVRNASNLKG